MELKFQLPDYCEDCKLMDLVVQQPEYVGIVGSDQLAQIPADVYCVHEIVCAAWKSLLDEANNKIK